LVGRAADIQVWDVGRGEVVQQLPAPGSLIAAFPATTAAPLRVATASGEVWSWQGLGSMWQRASLCPEGGLIAADHDPVTGRWLLARREEIVVVDPGEAAVRVPLPPAFDLCPPVCLAGTELLSDDLLKEDRPTEWPITHGRLSFLESAFPAIRPVLSRYGRLLNRLVACSASGKAIAALSLLKVEEDEAARYEISDRAIVRWWIVGERQVREAGPPGISCTAVAFAGSGRFAAVGLADGRVELTGLPGEKQQAMLHPLDEPVSALTFGPDDQHLIAAARLVRVVPAVGAGGAAPPHERPVSATAFSHNGAFFATADEGGRIIIWDAVQARPLHIHITQRMWLRAEPDPDRPDRTRFTPTDDPTSPFSCTTGHTSPVRQLQFTPDDSYLISTDDEGQYWVWDPTTGRAVHNDSLDSSTSVDPPRTWPALSADGRRLALLDRSGELAVWALDEGFREVFRQSGRREPAGLAISSEGDLLAVASGAGVEVIDLRRGCVERTFPGADPWGLELAFLETPTAALARVGSLLTGEEGESYRLTGLWLLAAGNARCRILAVDSEEEVASIPLPGRPARPIAGGRHRTSFAIEAGGQVLTWGYPTRFSIRPGSGDLVALAEGADRYPFCVLARGGMTVVEPAQGDAVVACHPLPLENIRMHPGGRAWCGTFGREVYLLSLERTEHAG
jgi:hypothetical protein